MSARVHTGQAGKKQGSLTWKRLNSHKIKTSAIHTREIVKYPPESTYQCGTLLTISGYKECP